MTSLFAATSLEAAAAPEKYRGAFLVPYGKVEALATKASRDPDLARKLWQTTENVMQDVLSENLVLDVYL